METHLDAALATELRTPHARPPTISIIGADEFSGESQRYITFRRIIKHSVAHPPSPVRFVLTFATWQSDNAGPVSTAAQKDRSRDSRASW